jgi:short-subunit dehydrogenase
MRLANRVVVVSGASSGIGAATAQAFARRGARVMLLARTRSALERVAHAIAASGGAAAVYDVDLADGEATAAIAKRIAADHGVPDVIVNCAGAGRWLFTQETSPAEAVTMVQAPYLAAFFLTRAFLGRMIARGSGRVVNVNSPAAISPWPGATGYAAARWALRGFNEALRVDLEGTGLGVTHVIAGEVESPYWEHNPGARERLPTVSRYFGTLTPQDVAEAIVQAVERERASVIVPFLLRVALALNNIWSWPMRRLLIASSRVRTGPRSKAS